MKNVQKVHDIVTPWGSLSVTVHCVLQHGNNGHVCTHNTLHNLEGARLKENWRDVEENEMSAFVGLVILQGLYKSAGEATEELCVADSRKIFSDTMTYHCFVDIRHFLSFDDKATRNRRREQDKLWPIRELWDSFIRNTTGAMIPDMFLTIHEHLAPFKGRCSFIQYMSAKPEKFGIKMWLCCDAETRCINNAQV